MKLNFLRIEYKCAQREAVTEKMSEKQLKDHKLKERLRIKNYRLTKSMKPTSSINQETPFPLPFPSQQVLGKTMKQLKYSLLSSPHAQTAFFVVKKLARSV